MVSQEKAKKRIRPARFGFGAVLYYNTDGFEQEVESA
jgi:hypothetical protein